MSISDTNRVAQFPLTTGRAAIDAFIGARRVGELACVDSREKRRDASAITERAFWIGPSELSQLLVVKSLTVWARPARSALWDGTTLRLSLNSRGTVRQWALHWMAHPRASELFERHGHLLITAKQMAELSGGRRRVDVDNYEHGSRCVVCGDIPQFECDYCGTSLCADHQICTECSG